MNELYLNLQLLDSFHLAFATILCGNLVLATATNVFTQFYLKLIDILNIQSKGILRAQKKVSEKKIYSSMKCIYRVQVPLNKKELSRIWIT